MKTTLWPKPNQNLLLAELKSTRQARMYCCYLPSVSNGAKLDSKRQLQCLPDEHINSLYVIYLVPYWQGCFAPKTKQVESITDDFIKDRCSNLTTTNIQGNIDEKKNKQNLSSQVIKAKRNTIVVPKHFYSFIFTCAAWRISIPHKSALYCTLYNGQCTLYNVQCTLYYYYKVQ